MGRQENQIKEIGIGIEITIMEKEIIDIDIITIIMGNKIMRENRIISIRGRETSIKISIAREIMIEIIKIKILIGKIFIVIINNSNNLNKI